MNKSTQDTKQGFDFEGKEQALKWLVEPLIPDEQLVFFLAQAGVGKSLLLESLATSVVFGIPFCGFKTEGGDVLLIDQDTSTSTLQRRLLRFGRAAQSIQPKPKWTLFYKSMQGYSLGDNTLIPVIRDHPSARLVVIDSLHSVCGKLNPNYTSDMNAWARVKEHCLESNKTIAVNHHISQKWELSIDELMVGDSNRLAMGSSAIIQQADSYYIVGARANEGRAEKLYLRPVAKRVSIPLNPIVLRILEKNEGEQIEYEGFYDPGLDDAEYDIMTLFQEQETERTVKEVYEAMGHKHGEMKVRQALSSLEVKGRLLISRHKANLFRYRLP